MPRKSWIYPTWELTFLLPRHVLKMIFLVEYLSSLEGVAYTSWNIKYCIVFENLLDLEIRLDKTPPGAVLCFTFPDPGHLPQQGSTAGGEMYKGHLSGCGIFRGRPLSPQRFQRSLKIYLKNPYRYGNSMGNLPLKGSLESPLTEWMWDVAEKSQAKWVC